MTTDTALARLVPIVREVHADRKDALEQMKRTAQAEATRPALLWHMLLQSFATMGNSRGQEGLIRTQENYDRLRFDRLAQLGPAERAQEIQDVCRRARIRMPDKKAQWIAAAFERIAEMGGSNAADAAYRGKTSRNEKEAFLQAFDGIGPKYARNIPMDTYDEHFRDSIAIDVRLKNVSTALGLTFARPFPEHERFYQDVAQAAGLNGWELDRLLYHFGGDIHARLGAPA